MKVIVQEKLNGNQCYEGDVCFAYDCQVNGNLIVKGGNLRGCYGLIVLGKFSIEGGNVDLAGDLVAFEIEIGEDSRSRNLNVTSLLLDRGNIFSRGAIYVSGKIKTSGSIFAGVPHWKYKITQENWCDKEARIFAEEDIVAGGDIVCSGDIDAHRGIIISGGDIISGGTIWAEGLIRAEGDIECRENLMGGGVSAGRSIKCGWKITANYGEVKCGGKIYSGLLLKDIDSSSLQKGPTMLTLKKRTIGKIICGVERK